MSNSSLSQIFLVATPGLEQALRDEAIAAGFAGAHVVDGGVEFSGTWPDVWRANLRLRGATRVLVRIASFRALHLAQLDKRAHKVNWAAHLGTGLKVKVEAACRKSRIYHHGAAAQRVERAIVDVAGCQIDDEAGVRVLARIEKNLVTISLDTSGPSLHKRGFKAAVSKAPMRETMAALFLRQCGYDGVESVYDPMCGSGTFVIEAAEISQGLMPGRAREFAFRHLASFDAQGWAKVQDEAGPAGSHIMHYGSDRDAGAVRMAQENATRAGVVDVAAFSQCEIGDAEPPDCAPGLVMINAPYGARIGKGQALLPLYRRMGEVLRTRFTGWRVGLVTSDKQLAQAAALPFLPNLPPVVHGGQRIWLFRTDKLG